MNPNKAEVEPLLHTVKGAATRLSLSTWTVYGLLDSGRLQGVYQGSRRYVTEESLRAYIAALPTEPTAS